MICNCGHHNGTWFDWDIPAERCKDCDGIVRYIFDE